MHSSDLALSVSPTLSGQLKQRTNELLSRIVRTNHNTQFARTASEISEFHQAIAGHVDQIDDNGLSGLFQKMVHFTAYDAYAPLLARFSEKPCTASAIVDLLAPGLPDVIVTSSSTSGGAPKVVPKYNQWLSIWSPGDRSWVIPDPLRRRTMAHLFYLGYATTEVEDDDNQPVATIYTASGSVVERRLSLCLDPKGDDEKMSTFILDHAAPYAAGFISNWRSFLLIQAFFAMYNKSLETMSMAFINTFVDMMRHLDVEFDAIVDCIANGTIPDLVGVEKVRHHLEMNVSPDPKRAVELRALGRPSSRREWCSYVWPKLRSISCIASGPFASSVPLARWFLGPQTEIHPYFYACTEGLIGVPYNPLEVNQFKLTDVNVIELLDISKDVSISNLAQLWEVELGAHYEIVLTTPDGLWRYRLGDVVEICGFDPTDGIPIVSFVERQNVTIRFQRFMITEKELRAALSSVGPDFVTKIVDWTTTIDDRSTPRTIGFFVELIDELADLSHATERVLDEMTRSNENIAGALKEESFGKPTIRLVQAGTFSAFRQMKLDEGTNNLGQLKVPVVLPKPAYVTWFSNRVVREL